MACANEAAVSLFISDTVQYTGAEKSIPKMFFCFLLNDCWEFKSEILHTYLIIVCAHNSFIISLQRFKIIRITVLSCLVFWHAQKLIQKPMPENRTHN